MLFMIWLLEQGERKDEIGKLCRLIQVDYNNGCLPAVHKEDIIIDHFLKKHIHINKTLVAPLFKLAHAEFGMPRDE